MMARVDRDSAVLCLSLSYSRAARLLSNSAIIALSDLPDFKARSLTDSSLTRGLSVEIYVSASSRKALFPLSVSISYFPCILFTIQRAAGMAFLNISLKVSAPCLDITLSGSSPSGISATKTGKPIS